MVSLDIKCKYKAIPKVRLTPSSWSPLCKIWESKSGFSLESQAWITGRVPGSFSVSAVPSDAHKQPHRQPSVPSHCCCIHPAASGQPESQISLLQRLSWAGDAPIMPIDKISHHRRSLQQKFWSSSNLRWIISEYNKIWSCSPSRPNYRPWKYVRAPQACDQWSTPEAWSQTKKHQIFLWVSH